MLCLLCVTPLVCSFYSSVAPPSSFLSCRWQRDRELFTHILVLWCSLSTSSRQPQTTHVFADSRIGFLFHALRTIMMPHALHLRHQKIVFHSCLYTEPFELVIQIVLHYCTTPPWHKIDLFKRPFRGSRFKCLDDSFMLLTRLIFLYPPKILISVSEVKIAFIIAQKEIM